MEISHFGPARRAEPGIVRISVVLLHAPGFNFVRIGGAAITDCLAAKRIGIPAPHQGAAIIDSARYEKLDLSITHCVHLSTG
mgnify:CR=1 FL=1